MRNRHERYREGNSYLCIHQAKFTMPGKASIVKIGMILLAVFMTAVVLIGYLIGTTANKMHEKILREVGTFQVQLIVSEFKKTEELQSNLAGWIEENSAGNKDFADWFVMAKRMDAKLSRVWLWDKAKERFYILGHANRVQTMGKMPADVQVWVDSLSQSFRSGYREDSGMKYWTICRNCGESVLGFDISLPDLHNYFAEMSPTVRSYAFILNQSGVLLTHPDETMLGMCLSDKNEQKRIQTVIQSGKEAQFPFFSIYLSLPVDRIYYPVSIGSEEWIIAVNIPQLIYQDEMASFNYYTLLIAVLTILIFTLLLGFAWYRWRKEYDLRRKAEKEALELNMQQLKNQINPHFLFNSLNSLSILIGSDSQLAKEFVLKLSKVYRYLLEKRNDNLATVSEELEFARQYYFLQKIRFGEQLTLDMEVEAAAYEKLIPLLSVQLLIENAVKHNEVTRLHPLHIRIFSTEDCIVIENNYQPRADVSFDSLGVGFENIHKIYEYCSDKQFTFEVRDNRFVCHLPLIINRLID